MKKLKLITSGYVKAKLMLDGTKVYVTYTTLNGSVVENYEEHRHDMDVIYEKCKELCEDRGYDLWSY